MLLIGADGIMGVLIGQVACSLLALARGTIDSTRAVDSSSLHSVATKALLTFQTFFEQTWVAFIALLGSHRVRFIEVMTRNNVRMISFRIMLI